MSRTVEEILVAGRKRLILAPFKPSVREANILLGWSLGWTESQLLARTSETPTREERHHFEALLDRRLTGEPIAYLLGEKEFYGRRFEVDNRVLIPRVETEHLVDLAIALDLPTQPRILDIGTGSGCLAVTLALELPDARVIATDLSFAALNVASANIRRYAVVDRVQATATDLVDSVDLGSFDLVVANPPYVSREIAAELSHEVVDFEPDLALFGGLKGDEVLKRLLSELASLRSGTWLAVEIGFDQRERVRELTEGGAFQCLSIIDDYAGHPRVAKLQRRS